MEIEKLICRSFSVDLRVAKFGFNSVGTNVMHYGFEVSIGSKSVERDKIYAMKDAISRLRLMCIRKTQGTGEDENSEIICTHWH